MNGASTETRISKITMAAPISSLAGSRVRVRSGEDSVWLPDGIAVPDFWIDEGVEQVREKISGAIDRRDHQDAALNQRQVVPLERENHQAAESGIRKHRFHDDDAAD